LATISDAMESPKGLENLNKELSAITSTPAMEEPKTKKKRTSRVKLKVILTKGKRKVAVARVRIVKGESSITINGKDINLLKPREIRELILEPVNFSNLTREIADSHNIKINVHGGGFSGQAQAARTALAKAIASAASSDVVAKAYMKYDRHMLVDDVRQVEPKKFKGPKARARFQTSYR